MTWAGYLNTYYWIDPKKHVAAVFMTQVLPFADERALQRLSPIRARHLCGGEDGVNRTRRHPRT